MPSGSFRQVDVLCPFYKYDDGRRRIICEGIIDNSCLALIYHGRTDYEKQMEVFCCKHYHRCEIYNMLMKKWEDL